MAIGIFATLKGEPVFIEVVDLDGFVHAGPDENVFVHDEYDNVATVSKKELSDLKIEGLDTPQGTWPKDVS